MQGSRTAPVLSALCVMWLLVILGFRAFVYPHMYIAPDDPYGLSDVIELVLGGLLAVTLALAAGVAVVLGVLGPRPRRMAAARLALVMVAVAMAVGPLHTMVARWAPG